MLHKTFRVQCGVFTPQSAIVCCALHFAACNKPSQTLAAVMQFCSLVVVVVVVCLFVCLFCNNNLTLVFVSGPDTSVRITISGVQRQRKIRINYHSSQHSQKIKGRQVYMLYRGVANILF